MSIEKLHPSFTFTEDRLEEFIRAHSHHSPRDIATKLLEVTDRHASPDTHHTDDRTAVILRVR